MTNTWRTARLTPRARWAAVVVATVALVAGPLVVRSLPAAQSEVSASRLLAQVRDSSTSGWSGFVVTRGTLALPSVQNFDDVASLFGGTTQLRVWWQGTDRWRVDRLETAGETDLVHQGEQTTEYSFEDNEAKVSRDPSVRLPRDSDLLPPVLARRSLDGITAAQVTRLSARRVAGISAPGLRIVPASSISSIDHVDVWADPASGIPLRVEVYAAASGAPAFVSSFRDFSAGRPDDARVDYAAPPTTEVRFDSVLDIADAANQYAPLRPPGTLAGLAATSASDGAVGVYGGGLTQLISIPLRDREADALRDQLVRTPDAVQDDDHTYVREGVLSVMLTGGTGDAGFLLTGTVDEAALLQAADDAQRGYRYARGRG